MSACSTCEGVRRILDDPSAQCLPCKVALRSVKGAAEAFPVVCRNCGEPLTDRKSRERGYGPSCWALVRARGKGYDPDAAYRPQEGL